MPFTIENEVFDPKMDDTIVLNENIKAQLRDITGIPEANIVGARMGIKVENTGETEHTLAERTREMRGESLGHQYLYETAKEFPSIGGSQTPLEFTIPGATSTGMPLITS